MAHLSARDGYRRLVERLNRFPQGAPPSELLYRILAILFTEREAGLVALLPIKPFRTATAAEAWKHARRPRRARSSTRSPSRAILLDIERDGETRYVLPPPMAGFFEFSMMRVRDDVDQKAPRRALLRVPERRGGLRPGALHRAARRSSGGCS